MGVKEFLKKRRRKKGLERVKREREERERRGEVTVPTTSGVVTVKKESPLAKAAGRPRTRGGGGARAPSSTDIARQQAEAKRIAEAKAKQAVEAKRSAEKKAQQAAEQKRAAERRALETKLRQAKASEQVRRQALALQRRQQLKAEAARRGRGFTRLEAERFLGGGRGKRELREAVRADRQRFRKGEATVKEFIKEVKPEVKKVIKVVPVERVEPKIRRVKVEEKRIVELSKDIEKKLPPVLKGGEIKRERQNLENQIEEFNRLFGGKTLSENEFKKAQKISNEIEQKITRLEKKEEVLLGKEELPFERGAKVLPGIAKATGEVLGKFVAKRISKGVPPAERERRVKDFAKGAGLSAEAAVSLAQFAIPFVGQALFLGSLAEKPVLDRAGFNAQFKENPKTTSLLYGLGLVGVKGGAKNALSKKDMVKLNKEFKKAKIDFVAEADKKTLEVLAKTKVRGRTIVSRSDIELAKTKKLPPRVVKGKQITIKKVKKRKIPKKEQVELLLTKVAIKSKPLKKAIAKTVKVKKGKLGLELREKIRGVPFEAVGISGDVAKLLFKKKKLSPKEKNLIKVLKKRLKEKKEIPLKLSKLEKKEIAGVISPTEVENLFKVLAGDKRLRIYKKGGVKLIFDPRVRGFLKIKATPKDKIVGKKGLQKRIKDALPLPELKVIKQFTKKAKPVKRPVKIKKKPVTKVEEREIALASLASIEAKRAIKQKFSKMLKKKGVKHAQRIRFRKRIAKASSQIKKLQTKVKGLKKLKPADKVKLKEAVAVKEAFKKAKKFKLKKATLKVKKPAKKIKIPVPKIRIRPTKAKIVKIPKKKKKKKKVVRKKKTEQAYNVKARPLKKKGTKKIPKLVKVNKRPLSKSDAEDLRNYIADTSLARTAKPVKTGGKPKKPIIKVPKGYASKTKKKFRTYRIVKGKKKKLPQGAVIEKRTKLLDTKGEKQGISLKKRIAQLTPKKKKVRVKKKSVNRITKKKRTLSDKQLAALKKGRKIRMANLKKR
jgi:hypothetical protein